MESSVGLQRSDPGLRTLLLFVLISASVSQAIGGSVGAAMSAALSSSIGSELESGLTDVLVLELSRSCSMAVNNVLVPSLVIFCLALLLRSTYVCWLIEGGNTRRHRTRAAC